MFVLFVFFPVITTALATQLEKCPAWSLYETSYRICRYIE